MRRESGGAIPARFVLALRKRINRCLRRELAVARLEDKTSVIARDGRETKRNK